MRFALDHFPFPAIAERIWKTYFIQGGKAERASYKTVAMHSKNSPRALQELCIVSNFVEVFLARQGHSNPVGINYLEKIQMPLLPSIYGAMLAGVGYVLVGAGIPLKIPGVLDLFSQHQTATYDLYVTGALPGDDNTMTFSPRDFMEINLPPLRRPRFLAIIASNTLATTMVKKANGRVDGFVIEGPRAGGHNAPPRGKMALNENGEPVYGERDQVDLQKIRDLACRSGWLGNTGRRRRLKKRSPPEPLVFRWARPSRFAMNRVCLRRTRKNCWPKLSTARPESLLIRWLRQRVFPSRLRNWKEHCQTQLFMRHVLVSATSDFSAKAFAPPMARWIIDAPANRQLCSLQGRKARRYSRDESASAMRW